MLLISFVFQFALLCFGFVKLKTTCTHLLINQLVTKNSQDLFGREIDLCLVHAKFAFVNIVKVR